MKFVCSQRSVAEVQHTNNSESSGSQTVKLLKRAGQSYGPNLQL